MELQIDIKPPQGKGNAFHVELYMDGHYFHFLTSAQTAEDLKNAGLVKQVVGKKREENGDITTFEYPGGVDSSGVKYTSEVFLLVPSSPQPQI